MPKIGRSTLPETTIFALLRKCEMGDATSGKISVLFCKINGEINRLRSASLSANWLWYGFSSHWQEVQSPRLKCEQLARLGICFFPR